MISLIFFLESLFFLVLKPNYACIIHRTLNPHHGFAGHYTKFSDTSCKKGFLNGVAIEIFTGGVVSDERGATNVKMSCTNGDILLATNDDKK